MLSETSWNQVHGLPSNSIIFCGIEDPNNYKNISDVMRWIDLSDFYDKDNFLHKVKNNKFSDSVDLIIHLNEILNTTDLNNVSSKMKMHNVKRKEDVYSSWKKILESL